MYVRDDIIIIIIIIIRPGIRMGNISLTYSFKLVNLNLGMIGIDSDTDFQNEIRSNRMTSYTFKY